MTYALSYFTMKSKDINVEDDDFDNYQPTSPQLMQMAHHYTNTPVAHRLLARSHCFNRLGISVKFPPVKNSAHFHRHWTVNSLSIPPIPVSPPIAQESSTDGNPIRIGIVGCADIARKVSRAIKLSPLSTLYAVGSRSVEKAAKFAKDNGIPESAKVYGSYEALLDDPEVDAVYVPLPTSLHIKWAVLAAEKKKHLLLEKPVAVNVKELDVILEACESNGVQFMDSTMWMHHPRTAKMKEFLNDPENFGQLKSVYTVFTFAADKKFLEENIRVKPDLDALGALGDAGWYCIRGILWAADFELPKSVVASRNPAFNKSRVIIACGASMYWEDGKVATFSCSFQAHLTMEITAIGTKGSLRLNDFVIPFEEDRASFSGGAKLGFNDLVTGWNPRPSEHVVATDLPQEALMVKEFSRLVGTIKSEGSKPETKWPTLSRKTQLVLDAVKTSIEKGFEPVEIIS